MNDNMDILKTMLLTWSDEDVSQAWGLIAKEGNIRLERRTGSMRYTLKSGDKVSFNGRTGYQVGKIIRVKRKKAIIEVVGRNWDVPLSMLTKI
jgi:hypothetical protein